MAGGGIKPGITYGRTDDYGYNIADADGNPADAAAQQRDVDTGHDAHP